MKTYQKIILVLSATFVSLGVYFDYSDTITERKMHLKRYVKAELDKRGLYENEFEKAMRLDNGNFQDNIEEEDVVKQVNISNCIYDNIHQRYDASHPCLNLLVNYINATFNEETLIKAIAHKYFNYGHPYFEKRSFFDDQEGSTRFLEGLTYAAFFNRLRNPKTLKAAYIKHKTLLDKFITPHIYKRYLEQPINGLLDGYSTIETSEDQESLFKMVEERGSEKYSHSQPENWNISFWKRRQLEGTAELVLSILQEVKQKYQ